MDTSTVSALLGSIRTATELAKLIKESDLSLEKAEIKLSIAELISALADAKIDIADIQQTLLEKDDEIHRLKEKFKVKANVQWEKPYYWLIYGDDKDGPFCQHCFDKNQELIRLQGSGNGHWQCKACTNVYADSTYQPRRINQDLQPFDNGFRRRGI